MWAGYLLLMAVTVVGEGTKIWFRNYFSGGELSRIWLYIRLIYLNRDIYYLAGSRWRTKFCFKQPRWCSNSCLSVWTKNEIDFSRNALFFRYGLSGWSFGSRQNSKCHGLDKSRVWSRPRKFETRGRETGREAVPISWPPFRGKFGKDVVGTYGGDDFMSFGAANNATKIKKKKHRGLWLLPDDKFNATTN